MDEAERVLDRLRRIEQLERESAPPIALLDEFRQLLVEAEAWLRAEAPEDRPARAAVHRLGEALDRAEQRAREAERTLVA